MACCSVAQEQHVYQNFAISCHFHKNASVQKERFNVLRQHRDMSTAEHMDLQFNVCTALGSRQQESNKHDESSDLRGYDER